MPNPSLPLVLVFDVVGLAMGVLLIRKYLAAESRPLLYMLLPVLSLIAYAITLSLTMALRGNDAALLPHWDIPGPLLAALELFLIGFFATTGLFVVKVLRPGETQAWIIWAALMALIISGLALPYILPDMPGPSPVLASPVSKWLYFAGTVGVWGWTMRECFAYWRAYTKDMAAGKELDPVVVNRFFLWGAAAASMTLGSLLAAAYIPGAPVDEQPQWALTIAMLLTLGAGGFILLSWLPPQWYRRMLANG